ncbi:MAG: hypothetical protein AB8G05_10765 [Oligoflexales bacterium]
MKLIYTLYLALIFGFLGCRSKQGPSDAVSNSSSAGEPSLSNKQSVDAKKRNSAFNLYLLDTGVPKIFAPYASISSDEEFELAQIQLFEAYADEIRSEGLSLQNAGKAVMILRKVPTAVVRHVPINGPKNVPTLPTPNVIQLPSGLATTNANGFRGTIKSVRDQVKNINKKSGEKSTAEGIGDGAGESLDFIRTIADAGDPSAAVVADFATAITKGGSGVLIYGKEATKTIGGGVVKFTTTLASGGGVAGGVVGVSAQAMFNASLSASKHSPQLRGLFNKVVELRTINPGRSYSQIVKQLEGSPEFKPVIAELRSSSGKIKEDFFSDMVSGMFYTLMFSKGFKTVSKEIKKNPGKSVVNGEFDELAVLRERDDLDGVINGLGISQKEVSDMLEGVRSLRGDLDDLGGQFLRKVKADADDALANFQKNEGLSLTNSGDEFQMEVMMLVADKEGRPIVVLFDEKGNILRTGQDTFHIVHQDEYLIELLGE